MKSDIPKQDFSTKKENLDLIVNASFFKKYFIFVSELIANFFTSSLR